MASDEEKKEYIIVSATINWKPLPVKSVGVRVLQSASRNKEFTTISTQIESHRKLKAFIDLHQHWTNIPEKKTNAYQELSAEAFRHAADMCRKPKINFVGNRKRGEGSKMLGVKVGKWTVWSTAMGVPDIHRRDEVMTRKRSKRDAPPGQKRQVWI